MKKNMVHIGTAIAENSRVALRASRNELADT